MMAEANWVASCVSVKCHGRGCHKQIIKKGAEESSEAPDALWQCLRFDRKEVSETSGYVTQFPHDSWCFSLHHRTREIETLINQKFIRAQEKKLTFLILTFEEGISLVVSNFGFDQLDKHIVPPFALLLTCALHERRPIGRLNENRVGVTRDLFSVRYLDAIRHVDAGLRYRLGLGTEK